MVICFVSSLPLNSHSQSHSPFNFHYSLRQTQAGSLRWGKHRLKAKTTNEMKGWELSWNGFVCGRWALPHNPPIHPLKPAKRNSIPLINSNQFHSISSLALLDELMEEIKRTTECIKLRPGY